MKCLTNIADYVSLLTEISVGIEVEICDTYVATVRTYLGRWEWSYRGSWDSDTCSTESFLMDLDIVHTHSLGIGTHIGVVNPHHHFVGIRTNVGDEDFYLSRSEAKHTERVYRDIEWEYATDTLSFSWRDTLACIQDIGINVCPIQPAHRMQHPDAWSENSHHLSIILPNIWIIKHHIVDLSRPLILIHFDPLFTVGFERHSKLFNSWAHCEYLYALENQSASYRHRWVSPHNKNRKEWRDLDEQLLWDRNRYVPRS